MRLRWLPVLFLAVSPEYQALAQGEITVIAPGGIRAAMEQLLPGFEKKGSYRVNTTFGSGIGTRERVARGDSCDVAIVQEPYEDVLASGNVVANSATPLARIALGIAVRQGAPMPSIATAGDVKRTLLAAKSVAYPDAKGAAAGVQFDQALQKLGIAGQIEPKLKRTPSGTAAMRMVAIGQVEIGITFVSDIHVPGIVVVGFLPEDVSPPISVVGFISQHTKDPAAAKTLLQYLSSSRAAAVYKEKGMMSTY